MPTISVIVPVYNTGKYLHRCIDSILAQTFADYELLLVDDGSTDRSGELCEEYAAKDSRIRVFHQKNQGQAAARNYALDWLFSNSDSEYIAFIDSDDWVHPRYLELLYQAIQNYEDVNISQCLFKKTTGSIEERACDAEIISITPEEQYTKWYCSFMPCKLFRKKCWDQMRMPEGQIYEDVAIWYKMIFRERHIALVKAELYFYYFNAESSSRRDWTPAKLAQIDAWEDQLRFAKGHGSKPVLQTVLKRFCWVYKHQCEEITTSNKISERERKYYYSRLRRRLRVVLLQYRNELQEIGIYSNYFSWAFPKLDWLYWTLRGIWGKLKRSFKL